MFLWRVSISRIPADSDRPQFFDLGMYDVRAYDPNAASAAAKALARGNLTYQAEIGPQDQLVARNIKLLSKPDEFEAVPDAMEFTPQADDAEA